MIRILVEFLLPVVLPTVVYFLWAASERRRKARLDAGETLRWQDAPWLWLAGIGVALTAVLSAGLALFGGETIEGVYVPPRLEDGRIVPGHVEPVPPRP